MENKDKMAFPFYEPGSGFSSVSEGLTKLEFFACNAPNEIPGWFVHTPAEWEEVFPPQATKIVNEELRKRALDWVRDPIYDLPQELDWFQDEYEKYWESKRQFAIADEQARYFQWRRHYAEQLLAELSNPQP
jgi:hypothetical protein